METNLGPRLHAPSAAVRSLTPSNKASRTYNDEALRGSKCNKVWLTKKINRKQVCFLPIELTWFFSVLKVGKSGCAHFQCWYYYIYICIYTYIYIYYTVCFRCPLQLKGRSLGTPDSGETKVRHQCALLQNQALLSRVGSCILQNQEPSVESSDLLRLSTFMHATKSNSQLVNASMISTCDVQFPERFWWNLCLSRFCRVFFVDFVAWVYFFCFTRFTRPSKVPSACFFRFWDLKAKIPLTSLKNIFWGASQDKEALKDS